MYDFRLARHRYGHVKHIIVAPTEEAQRLWSEHMRGRATYNKALCGVGLGGSYGDGFMWILEGDPKDAECRKCLRLADGHGQ